MLKKINIYTHLKDDYIEIELSINELPSKPFYIFVECSNNILYDKKFYWELGKFNLIIKTKDLSNAKLFFSTNDKLVKITNPEIILNFNNNELKYWIEGNELLLEKNKLNFITLYRLQTNYEKLTLQWENNHQELIFHEYENYLTFNINPINDGELKIYTNNNLILTKKWKLFTLKNTQTKEIINIDVPISFTTKSAEWSYKLDNNIISINDWQYKDNLSIKYYDSYLYFNFKGLQNCWKEDYKSLSIYLNDDKGYKELKLNFKEPIINKPTLKLDFDDLYINNQINFKIKFITNINNFWVLYKINNSELYHKFTMEDNNELWVKLNNKINSIELLDSNLKIIDNNHAYSEVNIKSNNKNINWLKILNKKIIQEKINITEINKNNWQFKDNNLIYKGNDIAGNLNGLNLEQDNSYIEISPMIKGESKWISKIIKK